MIAIALKAFCNVRDTTVDAWNFMQAMILDIRQTRKQLEDQYGPLGF